MMSYKICPQCQSQAPLEARQCGLCGHVYRTDFTPPVNQTQAFYTDADWQRPPVRSQIPPFAAFLIGFILPIGGVVAAILLYTVESMKDPEAGKWALIGAVAGTGLGCLCLLPAFLIGV